ncbi:MAG: PAS domain-containing sensor histidine kinase, partial [Bacteriovorax sp.]
DINVFTPKSLSSGTLVAYRTPDLRGRHSHSKDQLQGVALNEILINGVGFYQGLIPLYNNHQFAGSIATLHSKEVVQKNITEMLRTLWLIAAAILLLIFPFAWYFSSSISRPISSLSRIFRDVASGKQGPAIDDELASLDKENIRHDELGDLTKSFIAMHDAVNQKIIQINEINASLEQTVHERTATLVLKEQESRTVIENSPDTIVRYDRECRRTYINPAFAAMTGGDTSSLLGKTPFENFGGSLYERKIREAFESGVNSQHELQWRGKDGKEFYTHVRLAPEFDLSGKVVSVLGVGRDITERKLMEDQLRKAILSRDEFISIASHELRTPLMALRLQLRMLLRYAKETANGAESQLIFMCERALKMELHLGRLVNELFDITHIRAGKLEIEKLEMELTSKVSEVISRMSENSKRSGSTIELFAPHLISGNWDPTRIDQIITNLLSNAIKYGEGKPIEIRVTARPEKNMAKIEVQDHGKGISPELHSKIFKQFERVNIDKDISGLDLGLFIVKQLVEAHGGTVILESSPGEGSLFTIELPLETVS